MRGVSQRTKDIIALAWEILAEDQPGAFGAYSLAGWSTLPQVHNPNQCIPVSGQDRKGSETLPVWGLPPPIQLHRGYPLPRFPQAADRLVPGALPHGFVENANLGEGSGTDARSKL